jgi:hypothetical protein
MLSNINNELLIQQDVLAIQRNKPIGSNVVLDNLLDEEDRLTRLLLRKNDVNYRIKRNETKIRNLYTFQGPIELKLSDLLTVEDIETLLNLMNLSTDTTNIFETFRQKDLLLEQQRIAVEKSEQRRNIGFFQLEYDNFRGNEFNEHMGFQVGIRLPITNPDRPDLNRRMLDFVADEADASQENIQQKNRQDLSEMDLEYSLNQYWQLHAMINQKINAYNTDNFLIKDLDDIYAFLKIKEAKINLLQIEFNLTEQIYLQYINWLYLNGNLVRMPLVNFLDKDLDTL